LANCSTLDISPGNGPIANRPETRPKRVATGATRRRAAARLPSACAGVGQALARRRGCGRGRSCERWCRRGGASDRRGRDARLFALSDFATLKRASARRLWAPRRGSPYSPRDRPPPLLDTRAARLAERSPRGASRSTRLRPPRRCAEEIGDRVAFLRVPLRWELARSRAASAAGHSRAVAVSF